ncbi:MAG: TrmJ/YjtD family RNA methyltransferase [Euryarchaeota archaeon]|nr:TrmJ/YjtD family RNA methyltransferase [Euryarchaeota archaeon]
MFYAVFVQPESPGNIGTLARLMKNFDIGQLVLVDPCDITQETYKFAVHAKDIVDSAITVDTLEEALSMIDISVGTTSVSSTVYKVAITPEELVKNIDRDGSIGIIIGRESNGLTREELLSCDIVATIPTSEEYPTLNAAVAGGILFYEIYNAIESSPMKPRLNKQEKDLLIKDFNRIVDKVERREHKNRISKVIFKRIIGRGFIASRESHSLKGILAKVLKKLD